MTFPVTDPVFQTQVFTGLLLLVLAIFFRQRTEGASLTPTVSTEIKGFAVLAIVLAHIGYYLAQDTRFLFPLSIIAGVGVNLFLLLSGYGLTHSMLNKHSTILSFYQRRVSRVLIPLWIVLVILLIADRIFLQLSYPLVTIIQSFFGFFPKADLYQSLDAPMWYLTLILFYYLFFPLVFSRKRPVLSACILAALGACCLLLPLPVSEGVIGNYRSHIFAFPIGVLIAGLFTASHPKLRSLSEKVTGFFQHKTWIEQVIRWALIVILSCLFAYTAVYSGIGQGANIEQSISLITVFCTLGVFLLKPVENRFLYWVGVYSYEIYLLHWPLMYRYDIFYRWLPASVATFAYLILLIGIGWGFQQLSQVVIKKLKI